MLLPDCLFGEVGDVDLRNHFSAAGIKTIVLPGMPLYNNDNTAVAESILINSLMKSLIDFSKSVVIVLMSYDTFLINDT